jgi:hypothetical protein
LLDILLLADTIPLLIPIRPASLSLGEFDDEKEAKVSFFICREILTGGDGLYALYTVALACKNTVKMMRATVFSCRFLTMVAQIIMGG